MADKLVSVTHKPVAALATVNALFGPHLRAETSRFQAGGLNYKTDEEHSDDTIADAPKGWFSPNYQVVPHPKELDPTALLILEREEAESDKPSSLVGRSSLQAEAYDITAVSSQFGEWWKEYTVIYERALKAEKMIKSSTRKKLLENRGVYEGDGDIAAFLLATGDLIGTDFGMSLSDEIDVMHIYKMAVELLKPHMDALDHVGFMRGLVHVQNTVGSGTLPHDGSGATFVTAASYEGLYESQLRRLLRHPHARALQREVILSRIPQEVCGRNEDFCITEGTDMLIIPADIMSTNTTPAAVLEEVFSRIDGMAPLTQIDYDRNFARFEDQFYRKGELVNGILVDRAVNLLQPSFLNVLLSAPVADSIQSVPTVNVGTYLPGTGGVGSVDMVRNDRVNVIVGMVPFYEGYTPIIEGGNADLGLGCLLPNGVLYMGSPADVTAVDWLQFLRWYAKAHSAEVRTLLGNSSRLKKDLKAVTTSIGDNTMAVAGMVASSQRNGVMSKAYASFNLSKYGRRGQQGPVTIDLGHTVGPSIVAGASEWTRTESTGTVKRISHRGNPILAPADGRYCSSFVGEPQGRKAPSPLITPRIPTSAQLGDSDIDNHVAEAMLSLPTNLEGTQTLLHTTHIGGGSSVQNRSASFNTRGMFHGIYTQKLRNIPEGRYVNLHPTEGFKRGYAILASSSGSWTNSVNMITALQPHIREASGNGVNFTLGPCGNGVTYNFDQFRPYGSTFVEPVQWMKSNDFKHTGYGDLAANNALPRVVWFWDPVRSYAIGPTNRELYGIMYNDVCFSAAQSNFVEVGAGAIRTRDLQSLDPSGMTTVSGMLAVTAANGVTSSTTPGLSVGIQRDVALLDSRIEQELQCYPAIQPTMGWNDRLDIVTEEMADDHQALIGVVTASNQVYNQHSGTGAITAVRHLSPLRRAVATMNGCSSNPLNRVSGYGLNATDGVFIGATSWVQSGTRSTPYFFDGPNIAPTNDDANVLIISGNGLCTEGYLMAHPYSVVNYLLRTMIDAPLNAPVSPYPLAEYGEQLLSPMDGVVRSSPSSSVLPGVPNLAPFSDENARVGNLPPTAYTTDRWFMTDVSGVSFPHPQYLSDLRAGEIYSASNPWKRSENDGYGYEVLMYDPATSVRITATAIPAKLAKNGEIQRAGFTNDAFRDIQTQGV